MAGKYHENCFACGRKFQNGLGLQFRLVNDNAVSAEYSIKDDYQGYDNISHGGIISTILDSSMVNLFYLKDGLQLKTAKLTVKFRKPVPVGTKISIKAFSENDERHFYKARALISVDDFVYAEAEGYFRK